MKINKRYKRYLNLKRETVRISFVLAGIFLAAFGLKGFLVPNGFIDGGVTGISLLMHHITHLSVSFWLVILNIPFIVLAVKQIGKRFAITTLSAILVLATLIYFLDFPVITNDKLLIAIFGGFFLGAGVGMSIRGGGVLDGTEIMAVYINRRSVLSIGDIILVINVLIFICAAFVLSLETALYSILTYLSASKTVDFIVQGIEEYAGVTIVSTKSNEIREAIINNLGRGVTIYKGERGFGGTGVKKELDIVFTVITRLEASRLRQEVERIDRKAFIVMNVITDIRGGMVKRRPLH
ncbi:YitT family protein [Pedobacter sp. BS3]|uniref:YitT family protein n=1 Tax=Pedobacter sp. BS3 TaxID=2567937 RepID=UPI0011F071AB|nr:YitT family protein [Pedobacter sp. BS3]TZF84498.1 YitT family protein [Pedobacter sp. BS3]